MSSIINIDDLTSYMNKSLTNAVAQQAVDAINTWVENYTNRCWGDSAMVTERYDWKRVIYLRHQDVQTIVSVKLGYPGHPQTTLDSGNYFVNPRGRLTFYAAGFGFGTGMSSFLGGNTMYSDWLEITYTYGVVAVPEDLKMASLALAALYYNWAINGFKDVVATSVGSYKVQFSGAIRGATSAGQPPAPALHIEEANWQIIDSYKTRRV